MSESSDATAIKAAINAQFTTPRAVEIDEAPAQTTDHIVVFLSRRYTDGRMIDGSERITGGRAITRYIARSVENIRVMRERTKSALEEKTLPGDVGAFRFEGEHEDLTLDQSDGVTWLYAADSWLY